MESQVIVITGASTGFGYRSALQLARSGHIVFAAMHDIVGHNTDHARTLAELAQREHLTLHTVDMDVTDDASVKEAMNTIFGLTKRIDVVVNNAGIWGPGILEAYTMQ